MSHDFPAFLALAAVVIVTPGPDTALTIRNTIAGGRRAGVFTAAGVVAGQLVWTLACVVGVTALLVASAPVFAALRWVGAGYLVFLGVKTLIAAFRSGAPVAVPGTAAAGLAPGVAARQGLLSAVSNPKLAVFFVSLFPQFVTPGPGAAGGMLLLGACFGAMTLVWLSAYAFAIAKSSDWLARTGVRRALQAVTGTVLVAFGVKLAVEHR